MNTAQRALFLNLDLHYIYAESISKSEANSYIGYNIIPETVRGAFRN